MFCGLIRVGQSSFVGTSRTHRLLHCMKCTRKLVVTICCIIPPTLALVAALAQVRYMRIALIHAMKHSIAPTEDAYSRLWPEAHLMNLLDDSLSVDRARDVSLSPAMTQRFLALARYAVGTGAEGILFTCSAFGPCI